MQNYYIKDFKFSTSLGNIIDFTLNVPNFSIFDLKHLILSIINKLHNQ